VRLINVAEDGRERKDVSTLYPELTASMLEAWKEFDGSLLPYEKTEQSVAGNVSGAKDD
jgi:hypothetical protein